MASDSGFHPSCGRFGVEVARSEPIFRSCASIKVRYDEYVDDEHTYGSSIIYPWNGADLTVDCVERFLSLAEVPLFIQHATAIYMILRCVDEILEDPQRPELASVLVSIVSGKNTADHDACCTADWDDVD